MIDGLAFSVQPPKCEKRCEGDVSGAACAPCIGWYATCGAPAAAVTLSLSPLMKRLNTLCALAAFAATLLASAPTPARADVEDRLYDFTDATPCATRSAR